MLLVAVRVSDLRRDVTGTCLAVLDFTDLYATSREYGSGGAYQAASVNVRRRQPDTLGGATIATANNPTASNRPELNWLGAAWSATIAGRHFG
ncbi:hypothetical protein RA280_35505 [Cupriavidus sp. CV2]|uniref:hypothetical protein n=1 Tax=Cupriavidus ulmosensis TaxID=3065913 RepID=UPI00296B36B4|nr:hypothetical protein [Cupriavidus sp. CV2]MDW3686955.1 hypothetical protein [Cupriavidus sp. CV2]